MDRKAGGRWHHDRLRDIANDVLPRQSRDAGSDGGVPGADIQLVACRSLLDADYAVRVRIKKSASLLTRFFYVRGNGCLSRSESRVSTFIPTTSGRDCRL
jgi:hypothetical protein